MNYEQRTIDYCLLSSGNCQLPFALYICREFSTNQPIFLQNKPNFPDDQMNVSSFLTNDYENKSNWKLGENKPNTNPLKPNFRKAKMKLTFYSTKDYGNETAFSLRKYKPNQTQFQRQKNAAAFGNQLAEIICSAGSVSFFAAIVAAIRVSAAGFRFRDDSVVWSSSLLRFVETV